MPWHDHFNRTHSALREVKRELADLKDLVTKGFSTMATTKQEVQADLDEIKQIVKDTRGAAASAIALLKEVLARVDNAAASATDLAGFRSDLALIKSETLAEEADLKAAVVANPAPGQ